MRRSVSLALVIISALVTGLSFFDTQLFGYAANASMGMPEAWGQRALEIVFYQFLHGGFFHLLSNSFFLVYFGPGLEALMGRKQYVGFFLGNTLFVYVALVLLTRVPTIGISGFCMAVLAYTALEMARRHHPEAKSAFFMLFVNVAIGLAWPVSLVGHAAGAIFWGAYYAASKLRLR